MRSATLFLLVLFALAPGSAVPQAKNNYPTPPEPLNKEGQKSESTPATTHPIDLARVQQEADDLARTAQSIPSDVVSVRKGMMPKDTIQKLRLIEKLSKHLRTELNP